MIRALLRHPLLLATCHQTRTMSTETPYKVITTELAPKAIGPYSQATVYNGVAYISGCIPFVPSTMTLVEGGIEAQAEQSMKNLLEVVKAAGSDKSHILKTTVFLADMNDFAKVNVSREIVGRGKAIDERIGKTDSLFLPFGFGIFRKCMKE